MDKNVSIIVPVYNAEKWIKRCVDSIIAQDIDHNRMELLLLDDGSVDSSFTILQDYAKLYSFIKVFSSPNRGVAKTRNNGILKAKYDYIMFIDNDDFIETNYISTFLCSIEGSDLDYVLGGCKKIDTHGNIIYELLLPEVDWSFFVFFAPWGRIYRRDFLLNNDIKFLDCEMNEDLYFNVLAYYASTREKRKIIPYSGYHWIVNETSISNTIQKTIVTSPIYTLERLYHDNVKNEIDDWQLYEYLFIKIIIWSLLFSSPGHDIDEILQQDRERFEWMKGFFPNYIRNKHIYSFRPKGEKLTTSIVIFSYICLRKIHLLGLFYRLYLIAKKVNNN